MEIQRLSDTQRYAIGDIASRDAGNVAQSVNVVNNIYTTSQDPAISGTGWQAS